MQKVTCSSTMAATRILPTKPHFLKPLLPGFHNEILIPTSFFKYLDGQKCENAMLRTGRGKVWPVKINGRHIKDGWTNFAQDHDLHLGHILVFRHEGNMVFDVMVFDPSACERQYPPLDTIDDVDSMEEISESSEAESLKYSYESRATEKKKQGTKHTKSNATSFMSGNPYFEAIVRPSNSSHRLFIPQCFLRSNNLRRCCKMIIRDQKQRLWPVKLRRKKSGNRLYIGHGWGDFYTANGLKDGDAFIFELIKKGVTPIMKFHWLEGNSMCKQEMTQKAKACSSALGHPYFCGTIKPSHLKKNQLHIPKGFARSYNLHRKLGTTILKNKKGGSWPVTLRQQQSREQVYIGCGWKQFALSNGLKVGDEFTLEFINGGKILIMNF